MPPNTQHFRSTTSFQPTVKTRTSNHFSTDQISNHTCDSHTVTSTEREDASITHQPLGSTSILTTSAVSQSHDPPVTTLYRRTQTFHSHTPHTVPLLHLHKEREVDSEPPWSRISSSTSPATSACVAERTRGQTGRAEHVWVMTLGTSHREHPSASHRSRFLQVQPSLLLLKRSLTSLTPPIFPSMDWGQVSPLDDLMF